jgi:alcohol dehydrogenase, propanol-preferring
VKVGDGGACHSDLHILEMPQPGGDVAFRLPLTLGHENAGWVEQLDPGTTGFES